MTYWSMTKTASAFCLCSETTVQDVTSLSSVFGKVTGVSKLLWPSSYLLHMRYLKTFLHCESSVL